MPPKCPPRVIVAILLAMAGVVGDSTSAAPGPNRAARQYVLPNGWAISPAGRQIELGGLPLGLVAVPKTSYVLATSNGYSEHFLAVIDVAAAKVVQRVPIAEGWLGLAVSADGRRVYASAGSGDRILVYDFADGRLKAAGEVPLGAGTFPAGLHLNAAGNRLYVTANAADALLVVDLAAGKVTARVPVGVKPYTCLVTADEKIAYVSNWGESSVAVVDLGLRRVTAEIKVQERPNDLALTADGKHLFVSCGNRNTVSVIDTAERRVIEQIDVAVVPKSPLGSTPNALALAAGDKSLLVATADNNAVAVIDVERPGHSRPRGFIPTGWYPTALCLVDGGRRLLIANGKGSTATSNRLVAKEAQAPGKQELSGRHFGYIAALLPGTLSLVERPDARTLAAYSQQVHRNTPLGRKGTEQAAPPFPLGEKCPIRYVFYIIKENRTYDSVLGDMKEGDGDPAYCLLPEPVTPNHHGLARQFVLLDHFYHDAEVSADGHHWVTSAYATDYVEKFWPAMYGGKGRKARMDLHDDPVAFSKGGFLWDLCAAAGLSYRSYGEFARLRGAEPGKVRAAMPSLEGHIHPTYMGADAIGRMSDSRRLELWLAEFRLFEARGEMPRFTVLSLPGDHLLGTRPGIQSPRAMMAENDLVLGKMIEAISHSRFWPQTAVFVVEDDAQNGPDHVDCHRTVALVASPYMRRRAVDSTMYSTSSMLRTMELILGLPPLTQFDASATPMWAAFQAQPGPRPYDALPARVPLDEKNAVDAYGAARSMQLTLDEADTVDEAQYNEILWRAIKGRTAPLPPRNVAAFVLDRSEEKDDPFGNTFYSEIGVVDTARPKPLEAVAPAARLVSKSPDAAPYQITIDFTEAPELKDWVEKKLQPAVDKWYPIIVRALPSEHYAAPTWVAITMTADYRGVAATAGTRISCGLAWFKRNYNGEGPGAVIHELVHVVQRYGRVRGGATNPGRLVEGLADYIRWFQYEPVPTGTRPRNPDKASFTDSYRTTAGFLNFVAQHHDRQIVAKLNAAMRQGKYRDALWKELTGKTVDELWAEYVAALKRHPPRGRRPSAAGSRTG